MGHTIKELREIRGSSVGSESPSNAKSREEYIGEVLQKMGKVNSLPPKIQKILGRYLSDMDKVLSEIRRVLRKRGRAVLVVGDSIIRGVFVRNSRAITFLGERHGLRVISIRRRALPANRRYLPPPTSKKSGAKLQCRMREEVIVSFVSQ
jgi:hypothetical protein